MNYGRMAMAIYLKVGLRLDSKTERKCFQEIEIKVEHPEWIMVAFKQFFQWNGGESYTHKRQYTIITIKARLIISLIVNIFGERLRRKSDSICELIRKRNLVISIHLFKYYYSRVEEKVNRYLFSEMIKLLFNPPSVFSVLNLVQHSPLGREHLQLYCSVVQKQC